MLSYKHAFHAGNHADVVKHLCLIATLEHYKKKDKPFCVFDTHAGAGVYPFQDFEVQKNKEFETGVLHFENYLASDDNLQRYLTILKQYSLSNLLPGSPAIGLECLRSQDTLTLMELHPSESQKLKNNINDGRVNIHNRDGFEGVVALSPPKEKRGVVLIDPPYEQLSEYNNVKTSVTKLLTRWQNACIMIWYPLLGSRAATKSGRSESLLDELKANVESDLLDVRLVVDEPKENQGMYGSGVLIINPPWQLDKTLSEAMSEIASVLSPKKASVEWL